MSLAKGKASAEIPEENEHSVIWNSDDFILAKPLL